MVTGIWLLCSPLQPEWKGFFFWQGGPINEVINRSIEGSGF